ncbi:MAG: riboflavin synthase [Pseudohongiellaceae bacterium]
MFTGIITATGIVQSLEGSKEGSRLCIATTELPLTDVTVGDSIAVNGCCLTVVEHDNNSFTTDISAATLSCTTFSKLKQGTRVNLEKAMGADGRFDGHLVGGHVDGTGELINQQPDGKSRRLQFRMPQSIVHHVAVKGSICIDGVSLVVNEVTADSFTVNIIPHTQQATIIGDYKPGQQVNLEADLIARYVARLLQQEK